MRFLISANKRGINNVFLKNDKKARGLLNGKQIQKKKRKKIKKGCIKNLFS